MNIRNPTYNHLGTIDCEIEHPRYGWIPFTASPDDVEARGREAHAAILAGDFGPVADYVAPVIPDPTPEEIELRTLSAEWTTDKILDVLLNGGTQEKIDAQTAFNRLAVLKQARTAPQD